MNNKCKVEKINGRYYIDREASHNPKIEELKTSHAKNLENRAKLAEINENVSFS